MPLLEARLDVDVLDTDATIRVYAVHHDDRDDQHVGVYFNAGAWSVHASNPDVLEALAERLMEAARDLRFAGAAVDELDPFRESAA